MGGSTEGPEFALFEPGAFPLVVAGEIDILPAERGAHKEHSARE